MELFCLRRWPSLSSVVAASSLFFVKLHVVVCRDHAACRLPVAAVLLAVCHNRLLGRCSLGFECNSSATTVATVDVVAVAVVVLSGASWWVGGFLLAGRSR